MKNNDTFFCMVDKDRYKYGTNTQESAEVVY